MNTKKWEVKASMVCVWVASKTVWVYAKLHIKWLKFFGFFRQWYRCTNFYDR